MLTAHRKIHPTQLGKYLLGWEIIDDDLKVIKTVKTRAEAQAIIDSQNPNACPRSNRNKRTLNERRLT